MSSDESSKVARVELDASVYRPTAIKKAAYRFGDRAFVTLAQTSPSTVAVTLALKPTCQAQAAELEGDFRNEVLDQELREVVATETEGIRRLILAQAFSKTSLLEREAETADFRADPLGIRRPEEP